jgi:hypothetical protein
MSEYTIEPYVFHDEVRLLPIQCVSARAYEELSYLLPRLKELSDKTLIDPEQGPGYELCGGYVRGTHLGTVVAAIYASPAGHFNTQAVAARNEANLYLAEAEYAKSVIQIANGSCEPPDPMYIVGLGSFDERMNERGLPFGYLDPILLEFNRELPIISGVGRGRDDLVARGPVHLSMLTDNCKQYILQTLSLGQGSLAHERLYPSDLPQH